MYHSKEQSPDRKGTASPTAQPGTRRGQETIANQTLKTEGGNLPTTSLESLPLDLESIPDQALINDLCNLLALDAERYFELARKVLRAPLIAAILRLPHKQEHQDEIDRIVNEALQTAYDRINNYDAGYIRRLDLWSWLYLIALDRYFGWAATAFHSILLGYLMSKVKNMSKDEADSIIQQALLNALVDRRKNGAGDLRPLSEGWLKVITRRAFKEFRGDSPQVVSLSTGNDGEPLDILDESELFDELIIDADNTAYLVRILYDSIEELPEKYREVLKLHKLQGYTLRETADRLGENVGNVKSLSSRGLDKLRLAMLNKLREHEMKR